LKTKKSIQQERETEADASEFAVKGEEEESQEKTLAFSSSSTQKRRSNQLPSVSFGQLYEDKKSMASRSGKGHGTSNLQAHSHVMTAHKWLWKLAIFSVVLLAFIVSLMFKLNNLSSVFAWPVVFLPVWIGFGIWFWFLYNMILLRRSYRKLAGAVPPGTHVIVLSALWLAALIAFSAELVVVLVHGTIPLFISPTLLFLPLFIAAGISLFAPVLPWVFQTSYSTYHLVEASSAAGGSGASARSRVPFGAQQSEEMLMEGGYGASSASASAIPGHSNLNMSPPPGVEEF
jgi:hypothetical protein